MDTQLAREVLGVDDTVEKDQIEEQFRHLMKKVHPDQGGSRGLFKLLVEARDTLDEDFSHHTTLSDDVETHYSTRTEHVSPADESNSPSQHFTGGHRTETRGNTGNQATDTADGDTGSMSSERVVNRPSADYTNVAQDRSPGDHQELNTRPYQRDTGEFIDLTAEGSGFDSTATNNKRDSRGSEDEMGVQQTVGRSHSWQAILTDLIQNSPLAIFTVLIWAMGMMIVLAVIVATT